MERRTWFQGLRGAKIGIFALSIIGASLISAIIHSRPTNAESFLQKTVGCVTDILALKNCAKSSATPATPASASNGQGATPARPASSSSSTSASPAAASSKPISYSGMANVAEQMPLSTDTVKPTDTLPALPINTQDLAPYESTLSMAYLFKTFGRMPTDATNAQSVLQPSEEGWRLFGVAWYWWFMAAAAMTAAIFALKRLRSQQALSLVK